MPTLFWIAYLLAMGCCVGSFLNVVIWRLPYRGREVTYQMKTGPLTLSWPPSHCPSCDAAIRWYMNVPILSWLLLRGRCAGCHRPIAVRYPLVELGTGLSFVALFLTYFHSDWMSAAAPVGSNVGLLALHCFLVAALLAASAIDADWFIIPLAIPYLMTLVALIAVPWLDHPNFPSLTLHGPWIGATLGALGGLLLANLALSYGWLPRSFPNEAMQEESNEGGEIEPPPPSSQPGLQMLVTGLLLGGLVVFATQSDGRGRALATLVVGLVVFLLGVLPRDSRGRAETQELGEQVLAEVSVPEARREMLKELLFLLPILLGAVGGGLLCREGLAAGAWLSRLGGVLLGFMLSGGVVWLVRILGTLGFGRVAMGLGDVHLMAGVGAVIGAPLAILAFFLAPFLGLLWALVLRCFGKPNVLPYGPWLSMASVVCLVLGQSILGLYMPDLFGPPQPPLIIWP